MHISTEEALLRQDDIWMLDGDDSISHEPFCRATRPDHLEFLRITPPEDDIMGDTPYNPRLDDMVSWTQTMNTTCSKHSYVFSVIHTHTNNEHYFLVHILS